MSNYIGQHNFYIMSQDVLNHFNQFKISASV